MDIFLWLQAKENATLLLALIGAVNGTLGLMISYLNRHDAIGQVQREQAQFAPWVSARIEEGDHTACMVRVTVFNPSALALVIRHVEVETPHGRQVILMHPNPLDLLGPLVPDVKRGATKAAVNWTVKSAANTPEKPSFHDSFIVAEHHWSPQTQTRWRPASRMRETSIALRFKGFTLSAAQDPVDIIVRASN